MTQSFTKFNHKKCKH